MEPDFLQEQSAQAEAALAAALSDAKAALARGMDPREWTRRYPLIAIGSALAAGFTTAVMTIPSKEQQELRKLKKIREALEPEGKERPGSKEQSDGQGAETQHSFWWTILREAVHLIRPVLGSALVAAMSARAAAPDEGSRRAPETGGNADDNPEGA